MNPKNILIGFFLLLFLFSFFPQNFKNEQVFNANNLVKASDNETSDEKLYKKYKKYLGYEKRKDYREYKKNKKNIEMPMVLMFEKEERKQKKIINNIKYANKIILIFGVVLNFIVILKNIKNIKNTIKSIKNMLSTKNTTKINIVNPAIKNMGKINTSLAMNDMKKIKTPLLIPLLLPLHLLHRLTPSPIHLDLAEQLVEIIHKQ